MNENKIIQTAIEALHKNAGLKAAFEPLHGQVDGRIDFAFDNGNERFYAEIKKELRGHQLPGIINKARLHQPFLVVAENIFPTLKEKLRQENIAYLDTAGNIYVRTPAHFIWIEGNKTVRIKDKERNRAFTKTGLKVVLYLLDNKEAINLPYRKLAQDAGVALGNINYVIEGLKDAGFIIQLNNRQMKLQNKKVLLDRWITGYGEILKPANFLGAFNFWKKENIENWGMLPLNLGKTFWGGEAAADFLTNYLHPHKLTVFTTEKSRLMKEWTLIPQDNVENGNVLIYNKFWKDEYTNNGNIAPMPVVYADLILTGDPRCTEAANMIFDKYMRDEFA